MAIRILIVCVLIIMLLSAPASAQDATSTWYSLAGQYNFSTSPVPATWTFEDAYQGGDFEGDFTAITHAVSTALSSGPPTVSGDDVMGASLEAWPD